MKVKVTIITMIIISIVCASMIPRIKMWEGVKSHAVPSAVTKSKPVTKCMVSRRRIASHLAGLWSLLDSAKHNRNDKQLTESVIAAVKYETNTALNWILTCQGEDPEGAARMSNTLDKLISRANSLNP